MMIFKNKSTLVMPISINFCACNINEKMRIYDGFFGKMLLVCYSVPYVQFCVWKWSFATRSARISCTCIESEIVGATFVQVFYALCCPLKGKACSPRHSRDSTGFGATNSNWGNNTQAQHSADTNCRFPRATLFWSSFFLLIKPFFV